MHFLGKVGKKVNFLKNCGVLMNTHILFGKVEFDFYG